MPLLVDIAVAITCVAASSLLVATTRLVLASRQVVLQRLDVSTEDLVDVQHHQQELAKMPDSLKEYIALESESWAQDELRDEAHRLANLLDYDWERVERELRQRHAAYDMQPVDAANISWGQAASPPPATGTAGSGDPHLLA